MLIGDDVAARVDDDAGAHAVDAVQRRRRRKFVRGGALDGPLAVDIDDGALDAIDDIDNRGAPRRAGVFGSAGPRGQEKNAERDEEHDCQLPLRPVALFPWIDLVEVQAHGVPSRQRIRGSLQSVIS